MITDVPTSNDFEQSGKAFLNLAWESAIGLFYNLTSSDLIESDDWGHDEQDYWKACQAPLATSLGLAQQGIELLIKARIASVSPFLLIVGNPREWPKSNGPNIAFADFRTIDAQDLIRVHDMVMARVLPDSFKQRFEQMRRMRNSIFHTVDKRIEVQLNDVLKVILEASGTLLKTKWVAMRREYLLTEPNSIAFDVSDYENAIMAKELMLIVDSFDPAFLLTHLGFNKKQRRYLCHSCSRELADFDSSVKPLLAQLRPNTATSTTLFCIACGQTVEVLRQRCVHKGCKGNVIEADDLFCCSCGNHQEPQPISTEHRTIGKFVAADDSGKTYNVFVAENRSEYRDEVTNEITKTTSTTYTLAGGQALSRFDKGRYKIDGGPELTSDDPNAL